MAIAAAINASRSGTMIGTTVAGDETVVAAPPEAAAEYDLSEFFTPVGGTAQHINLDQVSAGFPLASVFAV